MRENHWNQWPIRAPPPAWTCRLNCVSAQMLLFQFIICLEIIQQPELLDKSFCIWIFMCTSTKEVVVLPLTQFTCGITPQIDSSLWHRQLVPGLLPVVLHHINEPDTSTTQPKRCVTLIRGWASSCLSDQCCFFFLPHFQPKAREEPSSRRRTSFPRASNPLLIPPWFSSVWIMVSVLKCHQDNSNCCALVGVYSVK